MAKRVPLGELLVQAGLIDELQLARALGEQTQWGGKLGLTLLKLGFVREEDLVRVLAGQLRVPAVRLAGKRIDPEVIELVPPSLARKHLCLPLFVRREGGRDVLFVGVEDPSDLEVIDDLCFRTGMRVQPVLVGPLELRQALQRYYGAEEGETAASAAAPFPEARLEPGDTAPVLSRSEALSTAPEWGGGSAEASSLLSAGGGSPEAGRCESSQAAAQPSPDPPGGAAGSAPAESQARLRAVLRAVTELLIEKGVISREELVERVRRHAPPAQGSDSGSRGCA